MMTNNISSVLLLSLFKNALPITPPTSAPMVTSNTFAKQNCNVKKYTIKVGMLTMLMTNTVVACACLLGKCKNLFKNGTQSIPPPPPKIPLTAPMRSDNKKNIKKLLFLSIILLCVQKRVLLTCHSNFKKLLSKNLGQVKCFAPKIFILRII